MKITVTGVNIPAMSTLGFGTGEDENGKTVRFVGDHRPMRHIGEAIEQATSEEELPTTELEDWQIRG